MNKMKNRFVGIITVTFPDGYVEKCLIRQKVNKGNKQFIDTVADFAKIIVSMIPQDQKGKVTFKYKGDFYQEMYEALKKAVEIKYGETQLQTA